MASDAPQFTTWAEIDGEARGFRDGFVDLFRKYEKRPLLDENGDPMHYANGRAMVVNKTSFADHFGIDLRTFERWCKDRDATNPEQGVARHPENNRHNGGPSHDGSSPDMWNDELFDAQLRWERKLKVLDKGTADMDPLKRAQRYHEEFERDRFRLWQRREWLVFETTVLPEKMEALKAIADRGEPLPEPPDPTKVTEGLEDLPDEVAVTYGISPPAAA